MSSISGTCLCSNYRARSKDHRCRHARAVHRITERFDCCPDQLTPAQREKYFADLVESLPGVPSKSTAVVCSSCGNMFLSVTREWVNMVKAPRVRSLPDILKTAQVERLIGATRSHAIA